MVVWGYFVCHWPWNLFQWILLMMHGWHLTKTALFKYLLLFACISKDYLLVWRGGNSLNIGKVEGNCIWLGWEEKIIMKNIFLPIKVFILFCMCVWPILQLNTFSIVGIFCFLSHFFFFFNLVDICHLCGHSILGCCWLIFLYPPTWENNICAQY